jgi:acetyl-CoA carboxylase carboxyltransferase component
MAWKPELEELERRRELARRMGGDERIARAREAGRGTVRERIDALLDPGSFRETGTLAGAGEYDDDGRLIGFRPSNFVCGRGRIAGRDVVVGGDDFTVRGGAADGAIGNKMGWAEKAARGGVRRAAGDGSGGGCHAGAGSGTGGSAGGGLALLGDGARHQPALRGRPARGAAGAGP